MGRYMGKRTSNAIRSISTGPRQPLKMINRIVQAGSRPQDCGKCRVADLRRQFGTVSPAPSHSHSTNPRKWEG
jgi:hypothetical protein